MINSEKMDSLVQEQRAVIRRNDVILKFMLALAPKFRTSQYEAHVDSLVIDAEMLADEYLANAGLDLACVNAEIKDVQ
jgi:hypothetical protein